MSLALETIVTALEDTVRFDQSIDPSAPVLDASLLSPSTARLVYHPLLSNENLVQIAPNFESYVPPVTPTLDNNFSDWLADKRREAIRTVIMDTYNGRKKTGHQKEYLEDKAYFNGSGSLANRIVNEGKMVGFEIEVLTSNGLQTVINAISTQFDGIGFGTIDLYIFHTDFDNAIATITLTPTVAIAIDWHTIPPADGTLKFRDDAAGIYGGRYFIMYRQEDLANAQAINKEMNFGYTPCGSCNRYNYETHRALSRYVRMRAVYISQDNVPNTGKMFDLKDLQVSQVTNWGMNLRFTTGCDLTQFYIDRKIVLGDTIANQLRGDLIQEIINTSRTNAVEQKILENARFALQNRSLGGEGVLSQLREAKEALSLELSDIEVNICSPKKSSRLIKHGSI